MDTEYQASFDCFLRDLDRWSSDRDGNLWMLNADDLKRFMRALRDATYAVECRRDDV